MNRGGDLPPVQSCEGLGEPAYFYLSGVWTFAGMTAFLIFVIASYLRYINRGCLLDWNGFFPNKFGIHLFAIF